MTPSQRTLIIGGSSGIGLATAQAFLAANDTVIVAGRSQAKLDAAGVVLGSTVTLETVDATSDASVTALFDRIGPVDHVVVTSASGAPMGPFQAIGLGAIQHAVETKLLAQARVAHAASRAVTKAGSLTLVSGVAGRRVVPMLSAIGVANAGIEALGQYLAKELAPVRVNVIAPGLVDTPAYEGMDPTARTQMLEATAASLPVGRVGTAADIAQAILLTAKNGYLTGTVIEVDGGAHL